MGNEEKGTGAAPLVYTVEQVCELLQLSKPTVLKGIREGTIPSVRVGSAVRIPRDRLHRWLGNDARSAAREPDPDGWGPTPTEVRERKWAAELAAAGLPRLPTPGELQAMGLTWRAPLEEIGRAAAARVARGLPPLPTPEEVEAFHTTAEVVAGLAE